MLTRMFKSGNSFAVRIPKELAAVETAQDVEIERSGDALIIRPAKRRSLAGLMDVFASFTPDFMADGREFHVQAEREWGKPGKG